MRLQILELPAKVTGDVVETPFILVVSEAPEGYAFFDAEHNTVFRESVGAAGVILTHEVVEIGPPPTAEPEEDVTRILQEHYGVRA